MESCPKHGTKFMVKDGDTIYCNATIPRDKWGLTVCYYSPKIKPGRKKIIICTICNLRKAHKPGSLCKICRRIKQNEQYQQKKDFREK